MKKLKVFAVILCVVAISACFFACNPTESKTKLATPQNVACSETGLITWDAVENATMYVVVIDGINYSAEKTEFQVGNTSRDYVYSVYATAEGYAPSDPSPEATGKAYEIKGTLSAPANVTCSVRGEIKWDAVENATEYVVVVNGPENKTTATSFTPENTDDEFDAYVYATAAHYKTSPESERVSFAGLGAITVKITYEGGLYSGKTLALVATVENAFGDSSVTWSITDGMQNAEIDAEKGVVTANDVPSDTTVTVRATSNLNPKKYDEKTITVFSKPTLTQDMLADLANADKVAFDGFMTINLYTAGLREEYEKSFTYVTSTAMDGEYWYAQYVDTSTGLTSGLYYKNNGGYAAAVGVDLMNEEQYQTLMNDDNQPVTWQASGFYNPFKGLSLSDFDFDEKQWKYKYVGADSTLPTRMVAASNPYDFKPRNVYLVIEDGAVVGFYSQSEPDYTLAANYVGHNELTVMVNYGDDVEVKKAEKYTHDAKYDKYYSDFAAAIENMRALKSYTTSFVNLQSVKGIMSYSGYTEYATEDHLYFKPFTIPSRDSAGNYVFNYTGKDYGFKKINDGLYDSYYKDSDGTEAAYVANRAYNQPFATAKPTFAFSPEIFRTILTYEDSDAVTFVADTPMTHVASTLYKSMGSDIALYGLFATGYDLFGQPLDTQHVTNVTIENGYITKASFYYYFDYFYGIVELTFGDFNATTLPDEANDVAFDVRKEPSDWKDESLTVISDDKVKQMYEYMVSFFGSEQLADKVPFFGEALGDTFGLAMLWAVKPGGSNYGVPAISLYYDVLLETDRTINGAVGKVRELLVKEGFVRNSYGDYVNGEISVRIDLDAAQNDLDLKIYVWKTSSVQN